MFSLKNNNIHKIKLHSKSRQKNWKAAKEMLNYNKNPQQFSYLNLKKLPRLLKKLLKLFKNKKIKSNNRVNLYLLQLFLNLLKLLHNTKINKMCLQFQLKLSNRNKTNPKNKMNMLINLLLKTKMNLNTNKQQLMLLSKIMIYLIKNNQKMV